MCGAKKYFQKFRNQKMKAKLSIVKASEDGASDHAVDNILVDDGTSFTTKEPCRSVHIYLNITDSNFKIDTITLKNNGAAVVEISVQESDEDFVDSKAQVFLPSTPLLSHSDIKTKSKFDGLHTFDAKRLSRIALDRQKQGDFKGWKRMCIKLTQPFTPYYSFGLAFISLEQADQQSTPSPSLTNIIKGSTLDIPLLSDDEEEISVSGKDILENARKMAQDKPPSLNLNIKPDVGSDTQSSATTSIKKRTLPSGITAPVSKKKDSDSDTSDKSDKKTKKKAAASKSSSKFKFKALDLSDNDASDKSDDDKKKPAKKSSAKTVSTTSKTKKRKAKRTDDSDPSDTDGEDDLIDNASDADENGNLAGFVVTNRTIIKENKKLVDGPVTDKDKVLIGCNIAISGIQNPERKDIRDAALAMGCKYSPQFTKGTTTHLSKYFKFHIFLQL